MRKILTALTSAALMGLFPSIAHAQMMPSGSDIRHAYQPHVVSQTGWMKARVNNVVQDWQSNLVCVEAFRTDGMKTHLGCLTIDWNAENVAAGRALWAKEFNAPTNWLGAGSYTVKYTYQNRNGQWNSVKAMDGTMLNGTVTK